VGIYIVQEYHDIQAEDFNKLYKFLSEARLRYVSDSVTDLVTDLIPILGLTSTLISKR
jgi:hypothetical protein